MQQDLESRLEQLQKELNELKESRSLLGRFYSDHKRWIKFFTVGFVMTGLIVHATVPHLFQANTMISATQMNENFAHVMSFARGNIAMILENTTPQTITTASSFVNYNGTDYTFYDRYLTVPVLQNDGNVSTVNGATIYTAPSAGWYEVFIEGNIDATVAQANWTVNNSAWLDVSVRKVEISGSQIISRDWLGSVNASMNIQDQNGDTVIDPSNPLEVSKFRASGRSQKIYLLTGERMAVAIGGNLRNPDDSLTINSFRITVKRINL